MTSIRLRSRSHSPPGPTPGVAASDTQARIVANTHAFLTSNLMRPSLWQTDFAKELSAEIQRRYAPAKGQDPDDVTLPRVVARLRRPPEGSDLAGALHTHRNAPDSLWKRRDTLYDDVHRNRMRPSDDTTKAQMAPTTPGPWRSGLISMLEPTERGEAIRRDTRDTGPEAVQKGAARYAPRTVQRRFDYDHYDWSGVLEQARGMGLFADASRVNYGAGTSDSIPTETLAGVLLTQDSVNALAALRHHTDGIAVDAATTTAKSHALHELATAAIAVTVSEGHHALVEGLAPLAAPLHLSLHTQPPESVLVRQVMPARLRRAFDENLSTWIDEQFPDGGLGRDVEARLRTILDQEHA